MSTLGRIDPLVTMAMAEKLAALITEEQLEGRARRAGKQFQRALRKVRGAPPAEEDRLR